jgi:predicted nucleic acid-binding protein
MSALLDSSVLVAALVPDEDSHAESLALLMEGGNEVYSHAFLETFSTLTGGKLGVRVDADLAAKLLNETVLPLVRVVELAGEDILAALLVARKHGIRGGAVYDFMHLAAARKARSAVIYTLNTADFQPLRRAGDPEVRLPNGRRSP